MAKKIVMPKLGLTMKQGKIVKWYKKENDNVKAGEKLFSIETDKLTNDIEAKEDGVLRKILKDVGEVVPCLEAVAIIGDENEDISSLLSEVGSKDTKKEEKEKVETKEVKKSKEKATRIKASPVAKKLALENNIDLSEVKGTGPNGRITLDDVKKYIDKKDKVKTTPAAAKLAEKLDIDTSEIDKDGRIRKEDVYKFHRERKMDLLAEPKEERIPMSTMRRIIAERMYDSWKTAPVVHYNIRVDTTNMKQLRQQLKPVANITYTDILVAITSRVLLEFPLLNGTVDGEDIILRNYVNMGVAVALEDGLLVPVVKYSHIKGLKEISREIKDLSHRARNNQLETDEITGGTFTITNLGMFGLEDFTPIINQPESAILGVNTITETPMVENGNIVIRPMMSLSLTADHRIIDGAVAAQFLAKLKKCLENPAMILL